MAAEASRPKTGLIVWLVVALVALLFGVNALATHTAAAHASTTTTNAATCTYDVTATARVDDHVVDRPGVGPVQFTGSLGGSPSPSVEGRGRSTTPNPRGNATNTVDDLIGAVCSFSGETRVLMADGTTKPISEVDIGDEVLAYDPVTGERGPRKVTHLWVHEDTLLELELGGARVETTEDHPFWNATDEAWQQAEDLDVGDRVLRADGRTLVVGGLDVSTAFSGTAFNLTVDEIHTYFVQVGTEEVLVHNTGCDEFAEQFIRSNGGEAFTFTPPSGARVFADDAYALGPGEAWFHHTVVVKDGLVFDQFTGPGGLPIDAWKQQWGDLAGEIDFGF